MALMDSIKAKAKTDLKHIVLAEGTEPRTVEAAGLIVKEGIAKVTLLGDEAEIKKVAAGKSLEGVNTVSYTHLDVYKRQMYRLSRRFIKETVSAMGAPISPGETGALRRFPLAMRTDTDGSFRARDASISVSYTHLLRQSRRFSWSSSPLC